MSTSYLSRKAVLSVYIMLIAIAFMLKHLCQDTQFIWAFISIIGSFLAAQVIQKNKTEKTKQTNLKK